MANFQQDSSEAYLVIKGNPETAIDDEDGNSAVDVLNDMIKARLLILGDKKYYGDGQTGSDPDAYYLKKSMIHKAQRHIMTVWFLICCASLL